MWIDVSSLVNPENKVKAIHSFETQLRGTRSPRTAHFSERFIVRMGMSSSASDQSHRQSAHKVNEEAAMPTVASAFFVSGRGSAIRAPMPLIHALNNVRIGRSFITHLES